MRTLLVYLLLFGFIGVAIAQTTGKPINNPKLTLSLQNVVDLAISSSSSVKYAQNSYENSFWRWKNFKTQFRPQLVLNGSLPDYREGTEAVKQNDGSIEFKEIGHFQNNASLSVNQSIPQTGTQIYVRTSIFRNEDLIKNDINFSGDPFVIGFTQPVFAYNWIKWSRKTEPLIYTEAQKRYTETIEKISHDATYHFFVYMNVQTNYMLAANNLANSEDNLKIAKVKMSLGNISENDFSRIRLSVLTARKSLTQASMDLKNADFELKSYIGLDQNTDIKLIMPLDMPLFKIDSKKALEEAMENREEKEQYERRLIEADRDLTQAKRNNGLSATLRGSYGTSNISPQLSNVYKNPAAQKAVSLSLSIPILDWGKSKSNVKLAESKRDLVIFDVQQDRKNFERTVVVQVEQFGLLKDQLNIAKEADKVAGNGYKIALKKFQNGEISITDLNIALSDRNKAKRDYISSLQTYWVDYYHLRELTLYDFVTNSKIHYDNPLLNNYIKPKI